MVFFFVRNTLGVLFCQGLLWSCVKITSAKVTVRGAQSRTLSATTESTPTVKNESTVLLTSTNSTSLTTTIQSPSYFTTTLSTSLPTNELSFFTSTPKASSSLPTTTESKPLPTTKSSSLTTTIQWSSLPTAFDSTSFPTVIKSKTLPETTYSTFLPMTTRPKSFPTAIESSLNLVTMKSPSLPTIAESTTLPIYTTSVFVPKATKPTSLPTTTQDPSLSISLPTEHNTSETTKGENENKGSGQSSEENNFIVYGVVALCCVLVFLVALLFIVRRKDNFIMTCIKRNRNEAREEDTEGRGQEMSHYASVGDLILTFPDDDSPEDKNLPGQSADETQDSPVYDVLEGPYSAPMEGGLQSNEQLKTVHHYTNVNDGCVVDEEISYPIPSGNFEVSFLEEIYTTLNADRGNEEGNLYESLCDHKTSNERSDSWSMRGMQSVDQDYVSIVGD